MKQLCGCCAGIEIVTPEVEANRPGLPALAYRAGTYATFLETMLARLSTLHVDVTAQDPAGPLSKLTTRELSDPSIALMDSWATVADVLTFYQERIANEGYLRTATERRSILELAGLVGYRLRPGVSASVYLAFTVANGFKGAIPAGTRSQSIPGAGEKPQFFETSDDLPARDVWNTLKPRLTRPQVITLATDPGTDAKTRGTIYLQGVSTKLTSGDALLFVLGDGQDQQALRKVQAVNVQADQNRTEVTLEEPILTPASANDTLAVAQGALQPFVDEASSIFAGSDLAGQVAAVLGKLLTNIQSIEPGAGSPVGSQAADMVRSVIPQVQNWHDVAVKRKFTRLEPWIANLLVTLNALVGELLQTEGSGEGNGSGPVQLLQSQLSASPLENLTSILGSLSTPPSVQPANTLRLTRTVGQTFSPQSDTAPRLLAAFHPAALTTLYSAWAGVQAPSAQVQVYAMRVKASPFGSNAPLQVTANPGNPPSYSEWGIFNPVQSAENTQEKETVVSLDSSHDKIMAGSWVVVDTSAVKTNVVAFSGPLLYAKAGDVKANIGRADYGMSGKTTNLPLLKPADLSPSKWLNLSATDAKTTAGFTVIRNSVVYAQPELLDLAEEPLDTDVEGDTIELAQLYDGLNSGRWIIVSGERTDVANTTGVKASELVMISSVVQGSRAPLCALFPADFIPFSQYFYTTDANKYGDRLVVGLLAVDLSMVPLPNLPNQKYCDQVQLAPGVYASAYVPNAAERTGDFSDFAGLLVDPQNSQPFMKDGKSGILPSPPKLGEVFAWRISTEPVHTILTLANKLAYTYDSNTVTIYGNVVKATHGQTASEVLGNGNASQSQQKFAVHQSPLTYLSAPTPAGAQNTLVVRVNEVEWHEADNLLALGPRDREYITQTDDAEQTTVIFGTGEHGVRVPTGAANVKAVYRSGTGKAGNVAAQQISQLATQPLGAKGVINPLRASGGSDRDTRDQARQNAPLAVMALNRLVSVRDYADFARTYAGIGKASAARLSDGRRLLVHVTIAGKDDIPIDQNSDLYRNLVQALEQSGDPYVPIQVALRRLKLLVISAGVKVLPDYQWESVAPNVRAALLELYGFEQRDLGRSAFLSEAISAMQGVAGVQYVDVAIFDSVAESVTADQLAGLAASLKRNDFVLAELARVDSTATDPGQHILPAELVILTPDIPDTLILTEITV